MPDQDWSYKTAEDVKDIAEAVIEDHHANLKTAKISYLYTSKAPMKDGKAVVGNTAKVPDKQRAAFGRNLDFVITISEQHWQELTGEQRLAAIDHELNHCYMSEGKAVLRGHDLQEFAAVVKRHGYYPEGIEEMADAMQLHFEMDDEVGDIVLMGEEGVAMMDAATDAPSPGPIASVPAPAPAPA